MTEAQLGEYGNALAFIIGSAVFVAGGFVVSWLLAPHRPNPEKNATYECGEEAIGTSWVQFNMRFYVMGLVFLIFDVELLLLFPWATVFADATLITQAPAWGWFALIEAAIFLFVLLIGLVYVWAKGDIDWVKPQPLPPPAVNPVPPQLYADFNRQQAAAR
jgi:NADH-quinone oxidoreductase subunit A